MPDQLGCDIVVDTFVDGDWNSSEHFVSFYCDRAAAMSIRLGIPTASRAREYSTSYPAHGSALPIQPATRYQTYQRHFRSIPLTDSMDFSVKRFWSRRPFLSLSRNVLPRDMPSQSRPAWGSNVQQGMVDLRKYGTDRRDLESFEFRNVSSTIYN